ncbi:MAG TPA: molybdopterin cofactor-binding domain-containing protein [Opitutaceae bacterium]|nr:molybdopterin cofactor-binding domain-containing protein [Opitutaceae bacterium]
MSAILQAPLDRRSFLKIVTVAGGGLVLGYYVRPEGRAEAAKPDVEKVGGVFIPNAFIRIAPDGTVTVFSARPEVGQGIKTSLPMVVAEELGADWRSVKVVSAQLDPVFGEQGAGGSMSTPTSYAAMRRMGATARTILVEAAAQTWGVPASECAAADGVVRHGPSGRSIKFGDLVAKASTLPVPPEGSVRLKDPKDFTLLGSRIGGVDNPKVVTGQPLFGIDQTRPGMAYAVYDKSPVWGARPLNANLDQVKALPGVRDAFIIDRTVPADSLTGLVPGVAIVADSTWAAFSARRQLKVQWEGGRFPNSSWDDFARQARELSKAAPGAPNVTETRRDGDIDKAFADAAHVVEASYSYPFVAHANLEPQNCLAHVQGDRAEIWAPTQDPDGARRLAAQVLGIAPEKIQVTITRIGGGFGRRLDADPVAEAVAISQRVGVPVKLTWNRTDDLQHDHYRPGGFHFLKGAVDSQGRLSGWRSHDVAFGSSMDSDGYPARFVPNYLQLSSTLENGIPQGPWRAPGDNTYAWVICCFLDELAHAAGKDPVEFNLALLGNRDLGPGADPRDRHYNAARMRNVVRQAAEKSDWGRPLARGKGKGLGYFFSHLGYVAEVAEVTVSQKGELRVDRVVAAVDVGSQIVNLSGAENQVQGGIIDGLSAAWQQELDIRQGRVVQANFDDYSMLRINDAPRAIEVHFVKTDYPPTGLGEPPLPPLAPAVFNAIFAATGKRVRQFPLSRTDLSWS